MRAEENLGISFTEMKAETGDRLKMSEDKLLHRAPRCACEQEVGAGKRGGGDK